MAKGKISIEIKDSQWAKDLVVQFDRALQLLDALTPEHPSGDDESAESQAIALLRSHGLRPWERS